MTRPSTETLHDFFSEFQPLSALPAHVLSAIAEAASERRVEAGAPIYGFGDELDGLYVILDGEVETQEADGTVISHLHRRKSFGERGLRADGKAVNSARAIEATELAVVPAEMIRDVLERYPSTRRFFDGARRDEPLQDDLATTEVKVFMSTSPLSCAPEDTVETAAKHMRDRHVSSICVVRGEALAGIVTQRDIVEKVVADGYTPQTPVLKIMTAAPMTLPPSAIGSDVLNVMMERRIGHIPIVESDRLVGIVTQTDLTRWQAVRPADLVANIARAATPEEIATATAEIPHLLNHLVSSTNRHDVMTRLITDIADATTRRLVKLAHERLGEAPVPYVWAACGSQGRQEQTGVSDQDNCLILSNEATDEHFEWFDMFARFVSDGLDRCGYYYCPGDMMATNPRWRQPLSVWRGYFTKWISRPDSEARMLASVMFDLRPIAGEFALFDALQHDTLEEAKANSIFVSQMISAAVRHQPPLGLIGGISTIRKGDRKNTVDLKMSGVVPIIDLARVYAIRGGLSPVNTRRRIEAARSAGVLSKTGGKNLLDAYDLIARTRLEHQASMIRERAAPDNFLRLSELSNFERDHLRKGFKVVKDLQSAIGHGSGPL